MIRIVRSVHVVDRVSAIVTRCPGRHCQAYTQARRGGVTIVMVGNLLLARILRIYRARCHLPMESVHESRPLSQVPTVPSARTERSCAVLSTPTSATIAAALGLTQRAAGASGVGGAALLTSR
jgi:hypothetical protein